MKLNKFFMLGLAGLAFAACSNEDEVGNDLSQNSKTITVKIETGGYRYLKISPVIHSMVLVEQLLRLLLLPIVNLQPVVHGLML